MAIHTIRYRFGDFKLPKNFNPLKILIFIIGIAVIIYLFTLLSKTKPPSPSDSQPSDSQPSGSQPSPLYTEANIKLLNDYNNQLKYYIVDKVWAISYPLSDIMPGITFGTDVRKNSRLYLYVDFGNEKTSYTSEGRPEMKEYYRQAVDAINKFNEGTGLHIDKLV
jgi:hypothetical protein